MPDPAPRRETDEDYLDYIRRQDCIVCLAPADDPHHLDTRGSGGSDYTCVPLCRGHHREIGTKGMQKMEREYNLDFWRQAHRLLRRYFSTTDTPMR